jgi:hypothetical protein
MQSLPGRAQSIETCERGNESRTENANLLGLHRLLELTQRQHQRLESRILPSGVIILNWPVALCAAGIG